MNAPLVPEPSSRVITEIAPDAPPPHPVRLLAITPSAATAAAIFVIFFIIDTPFPDTMVSLRRFVVNRVSLFLSLFQ